MVPSPDSTAALPEQPAAQLPACLYDRAGFLLAKAHQAAHAEVNERLRPLDLNVKHYAVLAVLDSEGPLSQQALGEQLRIDRTTMVAFVDDLARREYVERRRNPVDRRAYALAVTSAGRAVLRRAAKLVRDWEHEFLSPLSDAEARQLTDLLQRLVG